MIPGPFHPGTIHRRRLFYTLLASILLFLMISTGFHFFRYLQYQTTADRLVRLRKAAEAADRLDNPVEAIRRLNALEPVLPEMDLRILMRRWEIVLHRMKQIRNAGEQPALQKDVPEMAAELNRLLDGMISRADRLLTGDSELLPATAWRLCNLRGAVRLVTAYLVLENEQNEKKAAGQIKAAIDDFAAAIDIADRSDTTNAERMIPRWNLELLHSEADIRKIVLTSPDTGRRLDLRENLDAMLPEGGYSPGVPPARRVEK